MTNISVKKIYMPSEEIVAREIEGELIIIPLVAGIGDLEDELLTLNDTGRAIWNQLNGQTDLQTVINRLLEAYDTEPKVITEDVLGLVEELVKRRMLVEA